MLFLISLFISLKKVYKIEYQYQEFPIYVWKQ